MASAEAMTFSGTIVIAGKKVGRPSKRLTFHVSRHSCASNLAENNVNLISIRDILGQVNVKETQRYAKVTTQVLIKAVSIFDNYIPSKN